MKTKGIFYGLGMIFAITYGIDHYGYLMWDTPFYYALMSGAISVVAFYLAFRKDK